jgi:hypothetical protein
MCHPHLPGLAHLLDVLFVPNQHFAYFTLQSRNIFAASTTIRNYTITCTATFSTATVALPQPFNFPITLHLPLQTFTLRLRIDSPIAQDLLLNISEHPPLGFCFNSTITSLLLLQHSLLYIQFTSCPSA